jgi:hypothetical protein
MFGRARRQPPPVITQQTIRLGKGRHSSPAKGACVMELASMLAGEPFTDHPLSVCPVIASFMRAYNDSIDSDRRQHLYEYASKAVGSRAPEHVRCARAERLAIWAFELRQERRTGIIRRIHERLGPPHPSTMTSIGIDAVNSIKRHTDETHAAVLVLIDELLQIGAPQPHAAQLSPDPVAAA